MNSLETSPTTESHHDIGMMVGMSTGKDGKHDLDAIPLGTAGYLLRADAVRQEHGAEGVVFFGNKRLNAKQANVDMRVARIRALTAGLVPDMGFLLEQDLPPDVLERVQEEIKSTGLPEQMAYEDHGNYTLWQTGVVGATLTRNGYTKRIKYGVSATVGGAKHGEHQYDQHLLPEWNIESVYGPADRDTKGNIAVPYLLRTNGGESKNRIIIPKRLNAIDNELQKIQPGIVRIALDTTSAMSGVILGEETADVLHNDHLAADPLTPYHLESVTNTHQIDDVKQRVEAALKVLIGMMNS